MVPSIAIVVERPEPPYELTDEQADEWRLIVGGLPADWFPRETHGLLAQYVRHRVSAKRIAMLLAEIETPGRTRDGDTGLDLEAYDRLLRMQERESRALASLATKMRLSQQTQYLKTKKRDVLLGKPPWEI